MLLGTITLGELGLFINSFTRTLQPMRMFLVKRATLGPPDHWHFTEAIWVSVFRSRILNGTSMRMYFHLSARSW